MASRFTSKLHSRFQREWYGRHRWRVDTAKRSHWLYRIHLIVVFLLSTIIEFQFSGGRFAGRLQPKNQMGTLGGKAKWAVIRCWRT
jgi:hypothetical protein